MPGCLPTPVKNHLDSAISENLQSKNFVVTLGNIVTSGISSSCSVNVKTDCGRRLYLFIKFLRGDRNENEFCDEGLIYFNNETVFYQEILELFKELCRIRINNSAAVTCAPNCLKIGRANSPNEPQCIIMEDLISMGYAPLNVKTALSYDCAVAILQQLGKFHAYSFALKDQKPQEFADATSKLEETVFKEERETSTAGKLLFIHAVHDALKLAKQSLPPDSIYVEKFSEFTLNVYERMASLAKGADGDVEYNVVTHGDLWINNILCKYNSDHRVTDVDCVTFVDFQGCRYASPVHDLMTVMLIGLDKTTREQHRSDLIRTYHMSLCNTLQEVGSDPLRLFPFSALQNQLLKHTQFALALALAGLPLFLNDGVASPLPTTTGSSTNYNADQNNKADTVLKFVQDLRLHKSMQCKNKMLEIIMDVIDQGYL